MPTDEARSTEDAQAAYRGHVSRPCADIFELEHDKIKRFDCFPEGSVILTQLGVISNVEAVLMH